VAAAGLEVGLSGPFEEVEGEDLEPADLDGGGEETDFEGEGAGAGAGAGALSVGKRDGGWRVGGGIRKENSPQKLQVCKRAANAASEGKKSLKTHLSGCPRELPQWDVAVKQRTAI